MLQLAAAALPAAEEAEEEAVVRLHYQMQLPRFPQILKLLKHLKIARFLAASKLLKKLEKIRLGINNLKTAYWGQRKRKK